MSLLSKRNLLRGNIQLGALAIMASLCAPLSNAAPIYKVIDEQTGQVTFTDRPQSYEDQAGKQVSQTSVNTGESSAPKGMPSEVRGNTDLPAAAATNINYQLSMIEPSTERAYQRPAQSIVIALDVKPALQNGDQVSIYLDDKEIAQGLSASIATVDLQPGPHSIRAVVKKVSGQTGQQVNRTVHVIQNTLILQNKKKLAEQLLAYERLPWHQKVLLKMRGNDAVSQ
ncbi:DUF4124 domain-containing protein [Psychrobacter sp. Arc29]|uniref:DUF4124 domain-containing protein n=1 Tax=Psychrobacter sp. Arc29 TaxID=3046690 RepID=UPI00352BFD83